MCLFDTCCFNAAPNNIHLTFVAVNEQVKGGPLVRYHVPGIRLIVQVTQTGVVLKVKRKTKPGKRNTFGAAMEVVLGYEPVVGRLHNATITIQAVHVTA